MLAVLGALASGSQTEVTKMQTPATKGGRKAFAVIVFKDVVFGAPSRCLVVGLASCW